ncbi:MAG: 50S ribosomal protein L15 [Candidatus Omnitrophica bacterium]|jgi:large subunit ribosomal protein L15|nr:50S ribosomal protein L15 [Candidatus Omnitrophota bacterium]
MKLHQIKPSLGMKKYSKRVGRGDASGHGATSTRGNKGHRSRKGFHRVGGFEGGQMPLIRKLPKRGFIHKRSIDISIVNIYQLNEKFSEGVEITPDLLLKHNLIDNINTHIKILGKGNINKKLNIQAHSFSSKAKNKIENIGGKTIIL